MKVTSKLQLPHRTANHHESSILGFLSQLNFLSTIQKFERTTTKTTTFTNSYKTFFISLSKDLGFMSGGQVADGVTLTYFLI